MRPHNEIVFESDIVNDLVSSPITNYSKPYIEGDPSKYNPDFGLYPEDLIQFIKITQPEEYNKVIQKVGEDKRDNYLLTEITKYLDTNGVLRSIRKGVEFYSSKFKLMQFKPDNLANEKIKSDYDNNILRVVRQVKYSPYHKEMLERSGHGSGILDLVIFVNGIPVVTMELKTDFTQSVHHAMKQYREDRNPINSVTKKKEPLLEFNRRSLVHFAVSNEEVYMTTKLEGHSTRFLPFNKGSELGGGNPINPNGHQTSYLWEEVLEKETLLRILGRFIHLQDKDKDGKKLKESELQMIFPRYHQLSCVKNIIDATEEEGVGHNYLIQHSAGSGKSNSIAWLSHQLASLTIQSGVDQGKRLFRNVVVITDRTVLDSQLQDTIYQFDHQAGVVNRISREDGGGSKSQKLTDALLDNSPIIIVTIQTFPHILEAITSETSLKDFTFAVIADEAHSSQTGKTATKLREILQSELSDEEEVSAEDVIRMAVENKKLTKNISYYAFTATPKPKTLEIFGRLRYPEKTKSKDNTPIPFHLYSMKQAIEEGFILDILKNYITYNVAYKIAHNSDDKEVDTIKAKTQINKWVRLHPHNIAQKIEIIINHFSSHVKHMLNGNAKAMVVTGSRKEAVRYKIAFDEYIKKNKIQDVHALVAFSGEVIDKELKDTKNIKMDSFTERNMNPDLNGEDLREAFDSSRYQVMLVANKFLTGFDQPKLCAMYIDKKLSGVDCVQTLSRLNRTYPGKDMTFILDFVNTAEDIKEAFDPFYKTTTLSDNSDPNEIFKLKNILLDAQIFTLEHVDHFTHEYYTQLANILNKKTNKKSDTEQKKLNAILSVPKSNFNNRYKDTFEKIKYAQEILSQAKQSKNQTAIKDAEKNLNSVKELKSDLDKFKSGVTKYTEFYEFMTNIIDYENEELEKLYVFLSHLKKLLEVPDSGEQLLLTGLELSHYKIHNKKINSVLLDEDKLDPEGIVIGGAQAKKKELLSEIIDSLNELFDGELSEEDALERIYTFGKSLEPELLKNNDVTSQLNAGNTKEQIMMGDYPKFLVEAIMKTITTNQDISAKLLNNKELFDKFARDMLNVMLRNVKTVDAT